jgi:AAHS family benzoate transporter-like MFS transporter
VNVTAWLQESRLSGFHWSLFAACLILNTMEGYDLYVYASALPTLMKALNLSETQAGAIASAVSLGTLLGALALGPVADKIGRKKIILWSAVLSCASMAGAGLSGDFLTFSAARFVFGFANGGLVVNVMALASEYVPAKSRATLVGMIASGASIGGLFGPLLGIWLFPLYGWRPVFLLASFLILLLPLYFRWLPEGTSYLARNNRLDQLRGYLRRARPDGVLPDDAELEVEKGQNKAPLREVFQQNRTAGTLLLWVCYLMNLIVIHGFSFWLPKLMINRGFSNAKGLSFLIPVSVASIVMTFVVGRIADRIGPKPVLVALFLLSCASIATLGQTRDYMLLMVLVGMAGVGFNGAQNMLNAYSPTYYPPSMRSTAMAYNFVVGRFGGIIGPTAVGMLMARHVSFQLLVLTMAVPSAVAALAMWRLPEKDSFTVKLAAQGRANDPNAVSDGPAQPATQLR